MPVKQGNGIMCTQVHYSTAARTARSCKAAQGPARSARVSDVIAISEPREFVPDVWICFTKISHPPPPRSAAMKRSRVLQADRPSGGLGGWATGKARARARRPATRSGIAATAAAAVARAAGLQARQGARVGVGAEWRWWVCIPLPLTLLLPLGRARVSRRPPPWGRS